MKITDKTTNYLYKPFKNFKLTYRSLRLRLRLTFETGCQAASGWRWRHARRAQQQQQPAAAAAEPARWPVHACRDDISQRSWPLSDDLRYHAHQRRKKFLYIIVG